nr:sugar phosphate isomerase/epimerase family protein [Candidatus Njordarchaeum guaymaensis]
MPKFCLGQNGFIFGQPWHEMIDKEQILEFAKKEGFKGIELHPYYESFSKGSEDSLREEYESHGLKIPCIQTGFVTGMYSPISSSEDTRLQFVKTMKEWIEFAGALRAEVATVSPPQFGADVIMAGYSHDDMVNLFIDALSQVVETAEENKVILAFEPEPQMILNGGFVRKPIEDTLKVLEAIKSKNVKVLYDTTHANTLSKGDPVGFLKALKGRVGWTHIADNDGWVTPYFLSSNHLEFGKGNIDIEAVMKTLKATCSHLEWLQVDVWESTAPFETAKKNKVVLESILKRIRW